MGTVAPMGTVGPMTHRLMTQCLFPCWTGCISKQEAAKQEAAATKKPGNANAKEKKKEEEEDEENVDEDAADAAEGCIALQQ